MYLLKIILIQKIANVCERGVNYYASKMFNNLPKSNLNAEIYMQIILLWNDLHVQNMRIA